jgi:hypothetical protein
LTGVVAQSKEVIRDGAHLQKPQKAVGDITATELQRGLAKRNPPLKPLSGG